MEDLEEHPEHGDESGEAGPLSEQMIPVQRLCVSIRRTHRRESKMIKQGWMNVKFDLSEVGNVYIMSLLVVVQLCIMDNVYSLFGKNRMDSKVS